MNYEYFYYNNLGYNCPLPSSSIQPHHLPLYYSTLSAIDSNLWMRSGMKSPLPSL